MIDRPTSSTTSHIAATDGMRLLVRHWPATEPWARMVLVHGVGEHSGRYERTAGLFAEAGIDVSAFDLRGHGGSAGPRGDIERWSDYLDDVALGIEHARQETPRQPVILLGHSMGGLICADYVLSDRPKPDLLVLSAPGLDDGLPRWQHALAPLAVRIVPRLAFPHAWGPEALSRDPEVGRAAREDPLCPSRATVRLGAFGFAAQERVRAAVGDLAVRTYVLHGADDPLVPVAASAPFEGLPVVTRRVYPGLRHESFNEPEGPAVVADVIAWLRSVA